MTQSEALEFREKLAALQHSIWSHWMQWLFKVSKGSINIEGESGEVIIPEELVQRWKRQMNTPYSELSGKEKDSDREQADKIFKLFSENV